MALILVLDDNRDLATLLAGAVSELGHVPVVFTTGREAVGAADRMEFHAAIVDMLLPDLRGQEVLRALGERGIPTLAMSGVFRGTRFAEEATQVYGARAYFEKPFDLHALLDAVNAIVGPAARPAPPVDEAPLDEAVDVDPSAEPPVQEEALRALSVERQAQARRPLPNDLPFSGREVWQAASASPGATRAVEPPAGAGELGLTSVPRLLAAAHQGRTSSELRLRRGPVIKVIWIQEGRPRFAASNVASERFGRYAVARGMVKAEELAHVQDLATQEKVRTGEAMVRLGLLTVEQRVQLLHDQAQQILWSTFDWSEGSYQHVGRSLDRADYVPLQLPLAPLVLRGMMNVPLVRLRDRVPPEVFLVPGADPPFELHELQLSAEEARLLMAADGTKTRDDLLALADLDERAALALLLGLLELRIIEPRAPRARKISLV